MNIIEIRKRKVETRQLFISCIVPIYNEQELVGKFIPELYMELKKISDTFEIIMVDDGSTDHSIINAMQLTETEGIKLLALSRNFGKECALTAGLEHCSGDVAVLIDCDFQHPIEMISMFVAQWTHGHDHIYGIRENRDGESRIKRRFANLFYFLIGKITKTSIPANAGDFRLMDRKVVDALLMMKERNRFMKGIYAWVGFDAIGITFQVQPRLEGKSSWKFNRLTELALTGITSFSNVPLRVWSLVGFIISFIAFAYTAYIVIHTLIYGVNLPGFATIVAAIMFFGGLQVFSIGILGEYIARIFNEVKQRPNYIVARKYGFD